MFPKHIVFLFDTIQSKFRLLKEEMWVFSPMDFLMSSSPLRSSVITDSMLYQYVHHVCSIHD